MKNNDHSLNNEPNLPSDPNGKKPFGLPADYFSLFEAKLKKKLELDAELSEFPLLSSIQKTNAFTEPANYFQLLENSLECKTELAAYPNLQAAKKPVFAGLEQDYNMQLHNALNYRIELAEELNAYQTLYAIDKVNAFVVSETYFESFAERVKDRVHAASTNRASVLSAVLDFIFGKKLALSFILVLAIGVSFYFNQTAEVIEDTPGDCKTLACLERQEILNNKAIANFDEDQLMDLVDVNSLNKQLNLPKEKTNSTEHHTNSLDSVSEDDLLDQL